MGRDANEVMDEIYRSADALRAKEPALSREQAVVHVLEENPDLYSEYDAAHSEAGRHARAETSAKRRGPRAGTKQANQMWVDAQVLFLQRTFALVPEVETQLRAICELPDEARNHELEAWAKKWNLTDSWCRQKAYLLVVDDPQLWSRPPDFMVRCAGWNPASPEQPEQAQERIRNACEEALKRHHREMQAYAESQQGWVGPGKLPHFEHFDWAVHYQVKGESADDVRMAVRPVRYVLADEWPWEVVAEEPIAEPLNPQSVQSAVNALLRLIELKKRREKRRGPKPKAPITQNSS